MRGRDLGYKSIGNSFEWCACADCGKARWVILLKGKPKSLRCHLCAALNRPPSYYGRGATSPNWKGGRKAASGGYIYVYVPTDSFFYPMATKEGYVMEHRLVVAKALGRCLFPWEVVHHKENYAKDDNRYPKTLELITDKRFHLLDTKTRAFISKLQQRIKTLEAKLNLLEKYCVNEN